MDLERERRTAVRRLKNRRGVSAFDYLLVLAGVVLPIAIFFVPLGGSPGVAPRMLRVVYEMLSVLVSWPFV